VFIFRNNLLNTVKNLYESKSFLSVVNILKETLKQQNYTGIEIPNYPIMTRYNQYIYMLNSLLELKNYHVCTIYILKLLNCAFYNITSGYRNYFGGVNLV